MSLPFGDEGAKHDEKDAFQRGEDEPGKGEIQGSARSRFKERDLKARSAGLLGWCFIGSTVVRSTVRRTRN